MRHAALAASMIASLTVLAPFAHAQDAATKLAQDAIIVDTHIDAPGILMDKWADLGIEAKDREFDYPKSRTGGLDVAFMSIYTSPKQDADGSAWHVANQMIDGVEAAVQRNPGKFAILTSPRDVERLLQGGRVLLPGAFHVLRETKLPPLDLLRAHGVPMAVATDCNPGTSPLLSLRQAMQLACTHFRLTPEEALRGATINAARALGLDDRGMLRVGLRADIAYWRVDRPAALCYWLGGQLLAASFAGGRRLEPAFT